MPLLETREKERQERERRERDLRETGERLARDKIGAMADGLIQTNKIARERTGESQRELERAKERARESSSGGDLVKRLQEA